MSNQPPSGSSGSGSGTSDPNQLYLALATLALKQGKEPDVHGVIAVLKEKTAARSVPREEASTALGWALIQVGRALDDQNKPEDALIAVEEAIQSVKEIKEGKGFPMFFEYKANLLLKLNEYEKATAAYEVARDLYLSQGKIEDLTRFMSSLVNVLILRGENDRAIALITEQSQFMREGGKVKALIQCLDMQAKIMAIQGDSSTALSIYSEQESLCRESNDQRALANVLANKGIMLVSLNELDQAFPLLEESERQYRELGDKNGEAHAVSGKGLAAQQKGELKKALEFHQRSTKLFQEANNLEGVAKSTGAQAQVYLQLGEPRMALPLAEHAFVLASTSGLKGLLRDVVQPILESARHETQKLRDAEELERKQKLLKAQAQYEKELKEWHDLPLLKRLRTAKPRPPA
jgi:tetratricopeptide (TPR) repeat protein